MTTHSVSPTQRAGFMSWLILTICLDGCGGSGGSAGSGNAQAFEVLYSFGSNSTDARGPTGVLFQGSDGNFYGTTYAGGIGGGIAQGGYSGNGTVFKITPTGEETVLYSFAGGAADGLFPVVLTEGSDGNFYGTTAAGGANTGGTVFRLTPEGVETILYSFGGAPDDGIGAAGLIRGNDGNFYGTTVGGGTNKLGTVFKLTPMGVETILYSFEGGIHDGYQPADAQPVKGVDGNFYGTTNGGPANDGTVFKATPEGAETVLHSFSGADGTLTAAGQDFSGLIQGSDGNFYGTTPLGGAHNCGTVFKLTPEGALSVLYSFVSGSGPTLGGPDGAVPAAGVIQGSDGNFYGTTQSGGLDGSGTLFKLTPAGVITVLSSFGSADLPYTNLIQGKDGNLYGTTWAGGVHDSGYFFRFVLN